MEWDRNVELIGFSVEPHRQLKVDRLALEAIVIDSLHMPEEVDLDLLFVNDRSYDRCLRSVIVRVRDQQFAVESICQFLGSIALSEVVGILGGVWTVSGELVHMAVALGPEVERLAANDESFVA